MAKIDYNAMHRYWMESSLFEVDGQLVLPSDWTCCEELMRIRRTMVQIAKSKDDLFRRPDRLRNGRSHVVASKLGRDLQVCLGFDVRAICKAFPEHRFDPYFNLFAEAYRGSVLERLDYTRRDVGLLNGFVEKLRTGARRTGFMDEVRNHERGATKNARKVRRYIDDLYGQYPKLLHVRIDLYYETIWPRPHLFPVSVTKMKQHKAQFMRHVRKRFHDAAVGHLWTVEYGDMKGPHFHMLLNFNGHKVRQGITIAQQLGEHWQRVITGGLGRYWNVNKNEDQLEAQGRRGIGTISHGDDKRRENLVRTALYLVKTDMFVRLIMPGFGKTFGTGRIVPRKKSKAGRKRKGNRLAEWVEGISSRRGGVKRGKPS